MQPSPEMFKAQRSLNLAQSPVLDLLSGDAHFTGQSPQSRSVHFIAS